MSTTLMIIYLSDWHFSCFSWELVAWALFDQFHNPFICLYLFEFRERKSVQGRCVNLSAKYIKYIRPHWLHRIRTWATVYDFHRKTVCNVKRNNKNHTNCPYMFFWHANVGVYGINVAEKYKHDFLPLVVPFWCGLI